MKLWQNTHNACPLTCALKVNEWHHEEKCQFSEGTEVIIDGEQVPTRSLQIPATPSVPLYTVPNPPALPAL